MKDVFVVMFDSIKGGQSYVDSVFTSEEEARKYCYEQNEWERSDFGQGDLWYCVKTEFHEK